MATEEIEMTPHMTAPEIIAQVEAQQPAIVSQLQHAVATDQLSHAFLFTGPRGRGQELVADWLAMRLMCRNPTADGQPDGMCDQCQRIAAHEHPDVIQVVPDGQSIKVDQVRFLRDEFTKTAVEGNQKVFVVAGADTMTSSAANGLLKFIEEPVGHQTAILIAENRAQILPTVVSRTQVIDFPALGPAQLRISLEAVGFTTQGAELARQLTDSVETAKEWLVDDWFNQAQTAVVAIVSGVLKVDNATFTRVHTDLMPLATTPERQRLLLAMFAQAWRDVLLGHDGDITTSRFPKNNWQADSRRYTTTQLLSVLDKVLGATQRLAKNISFQTTAESVVLEIQMELAG
jgi:DNA polymerase-3 subunit delta'